MSFVKLVTMIEGNTSHTKICYDFKSKFLQISDAHSKVIFYGQIQDINDGILIHEIIPELQEGE